MQSLTLAYRDDDRIPVIFAVREIAKRYYELDVRVARIKDETDYEMALFNGAADILIEHLEYLYHEVQKGRKITFFCAPSKGGGLDLVVRQNVQTVEAFRGARMVVRAHGQPHAVTLWLRMLGLEREVETVIIYDRDVGRWGQWKKVIDGECVATFMSPLYLPAALEAGLKVLPVPDIPIVGHFAQACLSDFARNHDDVMHAYVKSVLHTLAWLTLRPDEAFAELESAMSEAMSLSDRAELRRRFDSIVSGLKLRPYPTPQAIANSYEIATIEYPEAKGLNPLSLWDLHWVKDLDDRGFINEIAERLRG